MNSSNDTCTASHAEYSMANETLRYQANVKLAEVSVFVAISGGLLTVLFSLAPESNHIGRTAIKVFGLAHSLCFFAILESTQFAWFHFARRAVVLEGELGYQLWSTLPGAPMFRYRPSSWAMRGFYTMVVLLWIIALRMGNEF